jgi:heme/copper-type cytochrome/quinol oxidase subunit 2
MRLLRILFNFTVFVGLFFLFPVIFIFYFFIVDCRENKDIIIGKELFKPWE